MGIGDPNLPFNNNGNTINNRIQLYAGDSWKDRSGIDVQLRRRLSL